MMWGHYDELSWWWVVMPLGMVAFWALVAWVIVTLVRADRPAPQTPEAERILAERYARGEIDADEYRTKLANLRGGSTPVGRRST